MRNESNIVLGNMKAREKLKYTSENGRIILKNL